MKPSSLHRPLPVPHLSHAKGSRSGGSEPGRDRGRWLLIRQRQGNSWTRGPQRVKLICQRRKTPSILS